MAEIEPGVLGSVSKYTNRCAMLLPPFSKRILVAEASGLQADLNHDDIPLREISFGDS